VKGLMRSRKRTVLRKLVVMLAQEEWFGSCEVNGPFSHLRPLMLAVVRKMRDLSGCCSKGTF
jgi:hypothetical protein